MGAALYLKPFLENRKKNICNINIWAIEKDVSMLQCMPYFSCTIFIQNSYMLSLVRHCSEFLLSVINLVNITCIDVYVSLISKDREETHVHTQQI